MEWRRRANILTEEIEKFVVPKKKELKLLKRQIDDAAWWRDAKFFFQLFVFFVFYILIILAWLVSTAFFKYALLLVFMAALLD